MFPRYILFDHLIINFYGLFFAIGIISALLLLRYTTKFKQLNPSTVINFSIIMVILGFIGTRICYIIFHWQSEFQWRPWFHMVAFWRGGLMFQGGPILAVLCAPLILRRFGLRFWPTADALAPSLACGQAIGRIGCFFAGCCYGRPASSGNPLAVVFPPHSLSPAGVPLWPAQLMESVGLALLCGAAILVLKRAPGRTGLAASVYLVGAGLLRFVMDSFRADDRGFRILSLIPTTLIAACIFLVGMIAFIHFSRKRLI